MFALAARRECSSVWYSGREFAVISVERRSTFAGWCAAVERQFTGPQSHLRTDHTAAIVHRPVLQSWKRAAIDFIEINSTEREFIAPRARKLVADYVSHRTIQSIYRNCAVTQRRRLAFCSGNLRGLVQRSAPLTISDSPCARKSNVAIWSGSTGKLATRGKPEF